MKIIKLGIYHTNARICGVVLVNLFTDWVTLPTKLIDSTGLR